ncbi:MAG: hypothetical protein HC784_16190 [Hydrococcus sp. CSU_1_8]|nr:hypothetical protein [Hydrococcus sp. CSU_1_8]
MVICLWICQAKDRRKSRALIVEDNAGWHRSKKVKLPDLIHVEYLPPYSPELQPAARARRVSRRKKRNKTAERLWSLVDEPLVNEYFETINDIESVLVDRCNVLCEMTTEIKKLSNYSG